MKYIIDIFLRLTNKISLIISYGIWWKKGVKDASQFFDLAAGPVELPSIKMGKTMFGAHMKWGTVGLLQERG